MEILKFMFEIKVVPKQSARKGKNGFYQPSEIKDFQRYIAFLAWLQLPKDYQITKNMIFVEKLLYSYETKNNRKKFIEQYKKTRPDLSDNINKALFDALTGIVYHDDSQIVEINNSSKRWGNSNYIELILRIGDM